MSVYNIWMISSQDLSSISYHIIEIATYLHNDKKIFSFIYFVKFMENNKNNNNNVH